MESSGSPLPDYAVEAPRAAPRDREVEEDEAIEDRGITAIEQREHVTGGVAHPVRHRHFAGEEKRDGAREQPEDKQNAPEDLHRARKAIEREQIRSWRIIGTRREVQELLRAMLHEDQRDDDAYDREYAGRPHGFELSQHQRGSLFVNIYQADTSPANADIVQHSRFVRHFTVLRRKTCSALTQMIRAAERRERIVHHGGAIRLVDLRGAEEGIEQIADRAFLDAVHDEHQPRTMVLVRPRVQH